MTCHSGAGPDVYRCPVPTAQLISQSHSLGSHVTRHAHSLSIATVAAAAAAGEGEEHVLSGALMEDVERSPCALTHTIKAEGSRAFIYLSDCVFFFFLPPAVLAARLRTRCNAAAAVTFPRAIAPAPLPFVVWKQPFSCGDLHVSRPDA